MHIIEIEPTQMKCCCGEKKNNSVKLDVETAAYEHGMGVDRAEIRDLRVTPHRVIRDEEITRGMADLRRQGTLFARV